MNREKIKVAYLAPEIPAVSATFVYNEILSLEEKGLEIIPISVHIPSTFPEGKVLQDLSARTCYLYQQNLWSFVKTNLAGIFKNPLRYFKTLSHALSDSLKVGMLTHVGTGLLYRFLASAKVAEILEREGCRHLHAHFSHVPTDIAMYASGLSGISFSFTAHANDIFERNWLLKEKVERSAFAITISEYNRNVLAGLGAPREKIHVVYCGVDSQVFKTPKERAISGIPRIGSLGRLVEKKGFDVLIHACKKLKEQKKPFHLEIAGAGPLQKDLQTLVNHLELAKEVSFLGVLSHQQVPQWFKGMDLFVLAAKKDSRNDMDGIPVVLMEAMLAGVPVVSTRLSGIPELVEDGKTGSLADPGDRDNLAETMKRLLSDELLRKTLRRNAIRKVRSQFDLSINSNRLFKHFVTTP